MPIVRWMHGAEDLQPEAPAISELIALGRGASGGVLLAEVKGAIVGGVALSLAADGCCRLHHLHVEQRHRHQSIDLLLLTAAVDEATRRGSDRVTVEVDRPEDLALCVRLGFRRSESDSGRQSVGPDCDGALALPLVLARPTVPADVQHDPTPLRPATQAVGPISIGPGVPSATH